MQNTAMQKHQEEICRTPLLEEEKLLTKNLAGYKDYQKQVIYRLLPFIW
jgi:protein-S-isoprenylcysteine O-methyltransferase Ste14